MANKQSDSNVWKNRGGSRRVEKKIRNAWTEEELQEAIHEIDSVPGNYNKNTILTRYIWLTCTLYASS